jgi:hypothetical protein
MTYTPAEVLTQYLLDNAVVSDPGDDLSWPIYISHMPDEDDGNGNCVALYDTTGVLDGRLTSGSVIEHYGLQVKVRSADYLIGWKKMSEILELIRAIKNQNISLESSVFVVNNVSETTPVLGIGVEEGSGRRELFTVNLLATMKEE